MENGWLARRQADTQGRLEPLQDPREPESLLEPRGGIEGSFERGAFLAGDVADSLDAEKDAYAAVVTSEVAVITALTVQIERLGAVVGEHFGRHRDAEIYLSLPGLGVVLAARILGEFGDAPDRYGDAKARKNYAGTSPITRASGTKKVVLARYARNRRLGDALHQWAFSSMRGSLGATTYYQQLRARSIGHHAALRQLANRLVGILHGCLKPEPATTRTPPGPTSSTPLLDTSRTWDVC